MPFLVVSLLAFLLSFAAKLLADHVLLERVSLMGDAVSLQPSLNAGVAFGVTFPGPLQNVLVTVALLLVGFLAFRTAKTSWQQAAFGLIIGGALANIADRMLDGFVTDFFQVSTFPIFNVADSCITIGVALLLVDLLRRRRS